jgi:hypothetical protein
LHSPSPAKNGLKPVPGIHVGIVLTIIMGHVLSLYVMVIRYAWGGVGPEFIYTWFPIIESVFGACSAWIIGDLFAKVRGNA